MRRGLADLVVLLPLLLRPCHAGEPTFTKTDAGLPGVTDYAFACGDYDGDGDLDVATIGGWWPGSAWLCRNDAGTLTVTDIELYGVSDGGAVAWGDFDNDGDLDLATAGENPCAQERVVAIHTNGDILPYPLVDGGVGIQSGAIAWGDYDNDGDLDLAVVGSLDSAPVTTICRNNGDGTFTPVDAGLTPILGNSVAWGDYDNDGDLDLVVAGQDDQGNHHTKLFRNDGGTFADTGAGLVGLSSAALAWGDYDNDGDLDLAVAGADGDWNYHATVYRNDAGAFTDIGAGLVGLYDGSLAWGDYDNDGDLDLAIAGYSDSGKTARIYRNDGGTFTDIQAGLTGVYGCCLAWGDFDSDGDLDLLIGGVISTIFGFSTTESSIYVNDGAPANTPPQAPGGLSCTVVGNRATFQWNAAHDSATPASGLSYNLRVGTAPGRGDAVSGMADAASGQRRLAALGNAQMRRSWSLTLTGDGPFYWSVQTIDTAFAASPWAQEQMLFTTARVDARNQTGVENGTDTSPFNTLGEGVVAAGAGNRVKIARSVYGGSLSLSGKRVELAGGYLGRGAYPGTGDFSDATRNPDPATNQTVVDGGGAATQVACQDAAARGSALDGLTFRNGGAIFRGGLVLKRVIATCP